MVFSIEFLDGWWSWEPRWWQSYVIKLSVYSESEWCSKTSPSSTKSSQSTSFNLLHIFKNTDEFIIYRLVDRSQPINILLLEFQVFRHAARGIFKIKISRFTHMFTECLSDFELLLRQRVFLKETVLTHPKIRCRKPYAAALTSDAPDGGRMYPKHVELRIHQ